LVMREKIFGPFARRFNRKRSNRNSIVAQINTLNMKCIC